MAREVSITAESREKLGSAESRRLRQAGKIPGNVYGHKEAPQSIMVDRDVLLPFVRSGARVFDLTTNGQVQKTILRELQWDALGDELQHFDLLRVDPNETVTVHVPIRLRGSSPGVDQQGGILEQPLHSVTIECRMYEIPDAIEVKLGALELGAIVHISDLPIPESLHCLQPADTVVLHIVEPRTSTDDEGEGESEEASAETES